MNASMIVVSEQGEYQPGHDAPDDYNCEPDSVEMTARVSCGTTTFSAAEARQQSITLDTYSDLSSAHLDKRQSPAAYAYPRFAVPVPGDQVGVDPADNEVDSETDTLWQDDSGRDTQEILENAQDCEYCYYSPQVSATFRATIKNAYPFLFTGTRDANFCLNLFGYLAFPKLVQERTGRIVVPCRTLAVLDDVTWTTNYCAKDRLKLFTKLTGIQLIVTTWNYHKGLARTVVPLWPKEIAAAQRRELGDCGQRRSIVYFDTGESYGRSLRTKRERWEFDQRRQMLALQLPLDHPQRGTLELLNQQSDTVIRKIVRLNLAKTRQYILQMPESTRGETLSKESAMSVLDAVFLDSRMAYRAVDKTDRVYTIGQTLHQLPREARKLLLSGCTTLDLKAAQLAIAARLWDIPLLQQRLQGSVDHWQLLLQELRLSPEHKLALKTATYALLFGMSLRSRQGIIYWRELKARLKQADQDQAGADAERDEKIPMTEQSEVDAQSVGEGQSLGVLCYLAQNLGGDQAALDAAIRFERHSVTQCLVSAMERRKQKVAEEGGLTTVFGKKVLVPSEPNVRPGSGSYKREMRSALAQELQSCEQQLMLPVIKLIAERKGITIISYLHDGLTLHFEDKHKQQGIVNKLVKAVNEEAKRLGIETRLEAG